MRQCILAAVFSALILSVPGLQADEWDDIDDLFQEPDSSGAAEDEVESDSDEEGIDLDALTTREPRFTGRIDIEGGASYGLELWPTDTQAAANVTDDLSGSVLYDMKSRFTLDVRPRGHLRYRMTAAVGLNEKTLRFEGEKDFSFAEIEELFVDYTWRDNYFFRLGNYSMGWGRGRLLNINPANFVSGVSNGIALRGFFPAGTNGVTILVYGTEEFLQGSRQPAKLAYAAQFETGLGDVSTGISAHYQEQSPLQGAVYAATSISGLDVAVEVTSQWDTDQPAGAESLDHYLLANTFYEFGSPVWQIFSEYLFDSTIEQLRGHRAGIGLRAPLLSGWTPLIRWMHSFGDHSGQIIAGIDGRVAPNLRASVGIPVTYGSPGSFYRENNEEPDDRVAAFVIRFNLNFDF